MESRKRFVSQSEDSAVETIYYRKKNILNSVLTKIFYTRVHRTRKEAKRGSDHEGEKQLSIFRC